MHDIDPAATVSRERRAEARIMILARGTGRGAARLLPGFRRSDSLTPGLGVLWDARRSTHG